MKVQASRILSAPHSADMSSKADTRAEPQENTGAALTALLSTTCCLWQQLLVSAEFQGPLASGASFSMSCCFLSGAGTPRLQIGTPFWFLSGAQLAFWMKIRDAGLSVSIACRHKSPVQLTLVSSEACLHIFDKQRTLHTSRAYVRHTSDNLLPRASLRK